MSRRPTRAADGLRTAKLAVAVVPAATVVELPAGVGPSTLAVAQILQTTTSGEITSVIDLLEQQPQLAAVPALIVLGLYAVSSGWLMRGGSSDELEAFPEGTPERPAETDGQPVGITIDRAVDSDDRSTARDRVHNLAKTVLRRRGTDSDVDRAIETGTWTESARAAAFLGDETTDLPVWRRCLDWLVPEPWTKRYAREAVEEIDRIWSEAWTDD